MSPKTLEKRSGQAFQPPHAHTIGRNPERSSTTKSEGQTKTWSMGQSRSCMGTSNFADCDHLRQHSANLKAAQSRKAVKERSIFFDTTPVDIRSLIRAIHFKEARPPLSVCCTITPRSGCYSMVATTSKILWSTLPAIPANQLLGSWRSFL